MRLLLRSQDVAHASDARSCDIRRDRNDSRERDLDLFDLLIERALDNELVALSGERGDLVDGRNAECSSELDVDLTSIEVSRTIAADDDVVIGDLGLDDVLQDLSGSVGVSRLERIVGSHEQLIDAKSEDVLLSLGVVVLRRNSADGDHLGAIVGSCELSSSLERVLVVFGDLRLSFGIVQRTIGRNEDVLIVRYYFYSNNNFHNFHAPFLFLKHKFGSGITLTTQNSDPRERVTIVTQLFNYFLRARYLLTIARPAM